jgi:menaquinone-dependent protoporphyrinogen oxidase
MKIAILYISKHGTTEKIARQIAVGLSEQESKVIDIKKHPHPDLEQFEFIVLGSSIYAGKIQQRMDSFCRNCNKKSLVFLYAECSQPRNNVRKN